MTVLRPHAESLIGARPEPYEPFRENGGFRRRLADSRFHATYDSVT